MPIQDFGAYVCRLEKMLERILESILSPTDLSQEMRCRGRWWSEQGATQRS